MPNPRHTFEETALQRALGQRIRELRKARGWSQEDLADRTHLDRTYIVSVEQGHRNVSLSTIGKLANGLQVKIAELFEA